MSIKHWRNTEHPAKRLFGFLPDDLRLFWGLVRAKVRKKNYVGVKKYKHSCIYMKKKMNKVLKNNIKILKKLNLLI